MLPSLCEPVVLVLCDVDDGEAGEHGVTNKKGPLLTQEKKEEKKVKVDKRETFKLSIPSLSLSLSPSPVIHFIHAWVKKNKRIS